MNEADLPKRNLNDKNDQWWTIDMAAEHLQVTRATIRRYIRDDGLKLHADILGGVVNRDEVLAAFRARAQRQIATRLKKPQP